MNNLYIKSIKLEETESGSAYGKFVINSLHTGQGLTIGNLLRRVLLGDLEGTTITAVRIAGITSEFATIKGIREDVLEILLNLKGIVFKSTTSETKFGKLKVQGPHIVTANSIKLPPEIEIINPRHYIATISTPTTLEIEFKIEQGTGYKLANQTFSDKPENFLQVDAVFMPVQKVEFKIENVYDNSNQITERLFLEIWTNGSISPKEAIYKGSQFIINLLDLMLKNKIVKEKEKPQTKISAPPVEPYTTITIEELQLSVRAYNCLKKVNIHTVDDLLQYSVDQLLAIRNFGRKSADEIVLTLKQKFGIIFK